MLSGDRAESSSEVAEDFDLAMFECDCTEENAELTMRSPTGHAPQAPITSAAKYGYTWFEMVREW